MKPAEQYDQTGFMIVKVFNINEIRLLSQFTEKWVHGLFKEYTGGDVKKYPLKKYHLWSRTLGVDHNRILRAANRHTNPGTKIKTILFNARVKQFLSSLGIKRYKIWDEGLGWMGFRLIRPGMGDGYPFTRKEWGIAKKVISCWIPVLGHSSSETVTLVPGSHRKEYQKHLPKNQKFKKDEYRLAKIPKNFKTYRPNLKKGEVIFFHPRTLHSEDIKAGHATRLNLEFRVMPR